MLAPAARSAACRYFLTRGTSTARKKMDCRAGAGCARGPSTHTLSSPPGEEEASVASSSLASSGAWAAGCRGEVVSLKEWQGWGTSSAVPAMVTKVVDDLMALERETDAEMTFGGIGGKLQGSFKVQEDKKHREVYQALDESELKLQFFAARQIACRLLGSRGYLCQKCWLPTEDCMCSKLLPCCLCSRIHFWLYMHPKDFLRQNNTGKLLWQVFGIQSASLCLFGILEHEEIMWDAFKRAGKDFVWLLYPNKSKTTMSVPDILLQSPMEYPKDQLYQENDKKTLNFVLIDGTWSNASAMYKRLKKEEHIENEVMTNDDVLGDWIPLDQRDSLQQLCIHQLRLPQMGRGKFLQFPGSHPVSLNRDNLQLLRQRYYYATWKADGTRYMMLLSPHGCYLIDRKFDFRRVQLRFPSRNGIDGVHNYTLLDGEMIIDTLPTTGKLERRYLAYDLMVLNGESIVERPFAERWKLLEKEVIEPRNHDRRQNPIYRYDLEPFRVRRKDFWLLSTVTKLLKEFIPSLSHAADGLIFQGWDDPYVPRTHEGLLKWKYPEMNSVDFLFEVGSDNRELLFVYERGKKKLMDGARVTFRDIEDVSALSGSIIECSWNQEEQCWACMRIRTDKGTPNEISTYNKVLKSIKDNITEEVLLNEIREIVQLPMYADRIAKAQQMQHAHAGQRRR